MNIKCFPCCVFDFEEKNRFRADRILARFADRTIGIAKETVHPFFGYRRIKVTPVEGQDEIDVKSWAWAAMND